MKNKNLTFNSNDSGYGSFVFIIIQTIIVFLLSYLVLSGIPFTSLFNYIATFLIELSFGISVIVVSTFSKTDFIKASGLKTKPNLKQIILCIGLGLVTLFGFLSITNLFYFILHAIGYNGPDVSMEINNIGDLILSTVVMCITPAICEELLFRGLILNGTRKWGKWKSILFSAFLFMLMHTNPEQTIFQFILGVVMGYVVFTTGSLWLSIIIHFMNNFVVFVISYIQQGSAEATQVVQTLTTKEWVSQISISLIITACACIFIYLIFKELKPTKEQKEFLDSYEPKNLTTEVSNENTTQVNIPLKQKTSTLAIIMYCLSVVYLIYELVTTFLKGL